RFRYVSGPDKAPAAGYSLTARTVPDGPPHEVGMTDREGHIALNPGFADGLVIFRLLAGNIEPLDEFPCMPGETVEERTISIDPHERTVALETALNSLRDEVVDQVAVRARLEQRLKARADAEKWDEVAELMQEFRKLQPRSEYVERLSKLRDDAA